MHVVAHALAAVLDADLEGARGDLGDGDGDLLGRAAGLDGVLEQVDEDLLHLAGVEHPGLGGELPLDLERVERAQRRRRGGPSGSPSWRAWAGARTWRSPR